MQKITLLIICALMLTLLFGCTQPPSNQNTFTIGNQFTAQEQFTYYNFENSISVTPTAITDSRCPQGAQCIIAGEIGVDMNVMFIQAVPNCGYQANCVGGTPIYSQATLHLGQTTKPTETFSDWQHIFTITLNGFDMNKRTVDLTITQIKKDSNAPVACTAEAKICPDGSSVGRTGPNCEFADCPTISPTLHEKTWVSINPKQCQSNAWQVDYNYEQYKYYCPKGPCGVFPEPNDVTEKNKIQYWLDTTFNITMYDYTTHIVNDIVCDSCACARGDEIGVLVDANSAQAMTKLGWTIIGNENAIPCTMDAQVCPDGSAVGRVAPFCEFQACPAK